MVAFSPEYWSEALSPAGDSGPVVEVGVGTNEAVGVGVATVGGADDEAPHLTVVSCIGLTPLELLILQYIVRPHLYVPHLVGLVSVIGLVYPLA